MGQAGYRWARHDIDGSDRGIDGSGRGLDGPGRGIYAPGRSIDGPDRGIYHGSGRGIGGSDMA
jgi:hypothetical protein